MFNLDKLTRIFHHNVTPILLNLAMVSGKKVSPSFALNHSDWAMSPNPNQFSSTNIMYVFSFLVICAIFFIPPSGYAQCSFDSNDGGAITDGNFGSTSSAFTWTGVLGQSFTACGTGTLNSIGVLSIGAASGITITVYAGGGNGGSNLGSVSGLSVSAAGSIDDRSLLDMSSASISLTSGNTYTIVITVGSIDTRLTNNSIYTGGEAYSGTSGSPINDFLFSIDIDGPLPITLADFQAERLGEAIKLTWSTAIEQNNKGFEIEQSLDRESFEQIGFVEGAGNSSDEQKYEYTFQNPEAVYYRFKQIDLDGQYAYSPTRFIASWEPVKDPFIYPNPIAREVFIDNLAADQTLLVDIFDLQGRRISIHEGRKLEVEQQLSEKFEGLTKGIYFVHIRTLSKSLVQQVIKE